MHRNEPTNATTEYVRVLTIRDGPQRAVAQLRCYGIIGQTWQNFDSISFYFANVLVILFVNLYMLAGIDTWEEPLIEF